MKIKKHLVALLAGISLLCCGLFVACDNPSGVDKKDETEITNAKDGEDKKTTDTEKITDKDKTEDKNPSSDKDKNKDKQNDSDKGEEKSTETDDNGKENGGESDGEESVVAEETTLSIGDSSIVVKNTAEGIRFEWDKLPEDTALVRIMTWFDEVDQFANYAEINNPSSDKAFVDEYVNEGETYKYKLQFFDSNDNLLNAGSDNEFSIKSKGKAHISSSCPDTSASLV